MKADRQITTLFRCSLLHFSARPRADASGGGAGGIGNGGAGDGGPGGPIPLIKAGAAPHSTATGSSRSDLTASLFSSNPLTAHS